MTICSAATKDDLFANGIGSDPGYIAGVDGRWSFGGRGLRTGAAACRFTGRRSRTGFNWETAQRAGVLVLAADIDVGRFGNLLFVSPSF